MRLLLLIVASAMTIACLAPAPAAAEPPVRLSIETVRRVQSKSDHARPSHEQELPILWCISPDDPRCMPGSTDSDQLSSRHIVSAFHVDTTAARFVAGGAQRVPVGFTDGAPRDGVRDRLERPPRR